MLFNESAHSNCFLKISLVDVLIQHLGIWRYSKSSKRAIKSSDSNQVSVELSNVSKFTNISCLFLGHGFVHEIAIHVNSIWIEPSLKLAIRKSSEHIIGIIPLEAIYHIADLEDLWLVNHR